MTTGWICPDVVVRQLRAVENERNSMLQRLKGDLTKALQDLGITLDEKMTLEEQLAKLRETHGQVRAHGAPPDVCGHYWRVPSRVSCELGAVGCVGGVVDALSILGAAIISHHLTSSPHQPPSPHCIPPSAGASASPLHHLSITSPSPLIRRTTRR